MNYIFFDMYLLDKYLPIYYCTVASHEFKIIYFCLGIILKSMKNYSSDTNQSKSAPIVEHHKVRVWITLEQQ